MYSIYSSSRLPGIKNRIKMDVIISELDGNNVVWSFLIQNYFNYNFSNFTLNNILDVFKFIFIALNCFLDKNILMWSYFNLRVNHRLKSTSENEF